MSEDITAARENVKIPEADIAAANAGQAAVAEASVQAATAQHVAAAAITNTAPVQPIAVAANDHTPVTAGVLKRAEGELSAYLGTHLKKELLPELMLTLRPIAEKGHANLHLHFAGPEADADPIAFSKNVEAVLKHHPAFAPILAEEAHKPEPHSNKDFGADITIPKLSEHQYQSLIHALASTPAASITPLTELPKPEHKPEQAKAEHKGEGTAVAHADVQADSPNTFSPPKIEAPVIGSPTGIQAPVIQAPKIGFDHAAANNQDTQANTQHNAAQAAHAAQHSAHQATHGEHHAAHMPASTVANDNEGRAEHQGMVAQQGIAASRA